MGNESTSSLRQFKWLNKKKKSDVNLIGENSFDGYILEVDPEYPDELHEFRKKMLSVALKKIFLNWWMIAFMVKKWKI